MISREEADHALAALSKEVGIENLKLDQSNTALLAFGEDHELIFHYIEQDKRFHFWAPLDVFALSDFKDDDFELLQHMLQRNFPCAVLAGTYFAVDSDIGVALLGRMVPVQNTELNAFVEAVKAFAQQVMDISATFKDDIAAFAAQYAVPHIEDEDVPVIKV